MANQNWTEAVALSLQNVLTTGKVLMGEAIGADYTHDELPGGACYTPDAVCVVSGTEEVSAVLKICGEAGVPVTVRGAGTGQVGGCVPIRGGVVLSVKGMDRVLEYNEAEHTLRVQPGVLLQEVKAAAESHGMYYPPDPGEPTATIGGNAATNAAGPCAVKYGRTRDYVADAVLVLADGTVTNLSGNEAVLGSEGILAVITELTLKLVEKPGADTILLFPFPDTETAIRAAKTILEKDFAPAVAEYMDTDLVEFSGKVTGNPVFPVEMDGERVAGTLMVTLEGEDDDAVMEAMEAIAELAEDLECLDILVGDTPTMKRDLWAAHSAFHTSMESGAKSAYEVNIELPMEAIADIIEFAKETAEAHGFRALIHAHVGSGGIHIHLASERSREESAAGARAFCDAVYAKCAQLGGDIRGEYGVGYAKTGYLNETEKTAFASAKAAYDPKGILNPGKVVS